MVITTGRNLIILDKTIIVELMDKIRIIIIAIITVTILLEVITLIDNILI